MRGTCFNTHAYTCICTLLIDRQFILQGFCHETMKLGEVHVFPFFPNYFLAWPGRVKVYLLTMIMPSSPSGIEGNLLARGIEQRFNLLWCIISVQLQSHVFLPGSSILYVVRQYEWTSNMTVYYTYCIENKYLICRRIKRNYTNARTQQRYFQLCTYERYTRLEIKELIVSTKTKSQRSILILDLCDSKRHPCYEQTHIIISFAYCIGSICIEWTYFVFFAPCFVLLFVFNRPNPILHLSKRNISLLMKRVILKCTVTNFKKVSCWLTRYKTPTHSKLSKVSLHKMLTHFVASARHQLGAN